MLDFNKIRQTIVHIEMAGVDVTGHLLPDLIEFEHVDDTQHNLDEVVIRLADPQHKYLTAWTIERGSQVKCAVSMVSWDMPGQIKKLECGTFYVLDVDYDEPPGTVTIFATSLRMDSNFKDSKVSTAYENTTLKDIAAQVAQKHGLTLDYQAPDNPQIKRLDQDQESDAEFLKRKCESQGLQMTNKDGKLIIFDEKDYESRPSVFTVSRLTTPILKWRLRENGQGKFAKIKCKYFNPNTGVVNSQEWGPTKPPEGSGDKTQEDVDRPDEEPDDDES
jgi:phage protein D